MQRADSCYHMTVLLQEDLQITPKAMLSCLLVHGQMLPALMLLSASGAQMTGGAVGPPSPPANCPAHGKIGIRKLVSIRWLQQQLLPAWWLRSGMHRS